MSDDIIDPDLGDNRIALTRGNGGGGDLICDLHTKGSEVYLPQRKILDLSSQNSEFDNYYLQPLPDEVKPEVRSLLEGKRRFFTPLRIIAIICFICLAMWAVYYYFPIQPVIRHTRISRDGLFCTLKTYKEKCNSAISFFEKKDYRKVIQLLEQDALEISRDTEKIKSNGLLLGLYFDSVEQAADLDLENPRKIIENVVKNDPDRLGWRLDYLWLNVLECRSNEYVSFFQHSSQGDLLHYCKEFDCERWKEGKADSKKNRGILDLYLARMYFRYWCYGDPEDNLDKNDDGVEEREKAYALVKKYTEGDDFHLDFADLGIKICDEILDAGIGPTEGYYYFDGKERWLKDHVENAKNDLESRYKKNEKK